MKKIVDILLALVMLSLTACAQSGAEDVVMLDTSKTDEENLVYGNNVFALDLYQALKEGSGNLFSSPYSISSALAMTYAGARGETEQQMADTLHFVLPQEQLHPAFNNLSQELTSRKQETVAQDQKGFILKNANSLWGQSGYPILPDFLDVLADNYGAGIRTLDFIGAPEDSRLTINNWVNKQTENKINNLIPVGSIKPLTRLVLTNAVYFKANWLYPFSETGTYNGSFNLLDGSKVEVSMMINPGSFNYNNGNGYRAIELPYQGETTSMLILLPQQERFEAFENSLKYSDIEKTINELHYEKIRLKMPKLYFESNFELGHELAQMGMPLAFSDTADFSGITGKSDFWIDNVFHKAFISVNEAGTEATAATSVIMAGAAPGGPIPFVIDRPFIFLIRDMDTGTILFIGRVLNPLE